MSAMCRICMIADFKCGKQIYDSLDINEDLFISDQIMSICNVFISKEDGLSDLICLDCLNELKSALTFKSKCERTDEILRSLNSTKIVDMKYEEIKTELKEETTHFDNELPESYYTDIKTELSSEEKYAKNNLKYECMECGIKFKRKSEKSRHWKLHIYTCNGCKRQFKNKLTLEKHLRMRNKDCIYISKNDDMNVEGVGRYRLFCCNKCKYKSKRLIEIKNHIIIHTGSKPFQCNMCPNAYTQFGTLHYHKVKVHQSQAKMIVCEICGKNISTRQQLSKHLRTHSDKTYTCKICNAQLKSKTILSIHLTRHSGVKNYNCEQCGSTFVTQAELCNHRKTHLEKLRLFPCPFCEFSAKKKSSLKSHVEKHSKEKPFSCNICGRLFISAQRLNIHKTIIHNKNRNADNKLQCPICLIMFNHMKSLRRHIANGHNIKGTAGDEKVSCDLEDSKSTVEETIGDLMVQQMN